MGNDVRVFDEIGEVVFQLNALLDEALLLCGKGDLDGEVVDRISGMIHEAYQKQLELQGFKGR